MHKRDLGLVGLVGLVVNGLIAALLLRPGYVDAYYYFNGAVQLARGRGFVEDYAWVYLGLPASVSNSAVSLPSHTYWMPLTSVVAAPFVALGLWGGALTNDQLFHWAQIPFVALAALLPILTYSLAWRLTSSRRHAWASALITLFSPFYVAFWTNIDAFALFGVLASGALLAWERAENGQSARWSLVTGVCVGLAHLARADGGLLLAIFGVAAVWRSFHTSWRIFALAGIGYVLVMLPWFVRMWLVTGSILPLGGAQTLWLTHYNDIFAYPPDVLTPERYFATGWANLLRGKWQAVVENTQSVIAVQMAVVGFPFTLIGLWQGRKQWLYQLALLYALALFGLMTFVFTYPGIRGGFFHSSAALLPFWNVAMVVGVDRAVEAGTMGQQRLIAFLTRRYGDAWAKRFPPWQPAKSQPIFAALLVVGVMLLAAVSISGRITARLASPPNAPDQVYADVGQWLVDTGDLVSPVLINNPPGFYYLTGRSALVTPTIGDDSTIAVMRRFGVRWLVLDINYPPNLAALYADPHSDARFALRATFGSSPRPIYVFEWVQP